MSGTVSHIPFFVVAGCGALGNEVLKNLALTNMSIGDARPCVSTKRRLLIVDFDVVEEVNLDRSVLFRREDVGRAKVDAARDGILRLNPDVQVEVVNGDFAHDVGIGVLREADVIIGCVDSRWARYCINRLAMRAGRPWVDGGIYGLTGTARVFAPGRNCYACSLSMDEMSELRRRMPCSGVIRRQIEAGHAPTTAIVASVIGAIEAQEALKIASGVETERAPSVRVGGETHGRASLQGRMAVYEGETMEMKVVSFEAWDEDCPCHEEWVASDICCVETEHAPSVQEVLEKVDAFCLRDDCFVDYIVSRRDDKRYDIMLPGRKVADYVQNDRELGQLPLSDYYQHEYRWIDAEFPYKNLTLSQLGIPPRDILRTKNGFVEL